MCGIAGAFDVANPLACVAAINDAQTHRGPDDAGALVLVNGAGRERGAFGHRRLAIIDVSAAGHQPMSTRDGRYTIVFNGEIYNFGELRAELERLGASFEGHSDTEVLLHAWAREGEGCLKRLRGMFAFAVWDRREERLWLCRDRFGIKPLYYARTGQGLIFASELRALLRCGLLPRTLSRAALRSYLATGAVVEPLTAVAGAQLVPAGAVVAVTLGEGPLRVAAPAVFAVPLSPAPELVGDRPRAVRMVRDVLRDSVARHLVSDVPVGVFLSGGLDSCAVAALATESAAGRLDTFTVGFPGAAESEGEIARTVAAALGTRHHAIPVSGVDMLHGLSAAFSAMDQPTMDGINTFLVSRAVGQKGLKVVLSGLGGDEMFAGYVSFQRAAALAQADRVPALLRRAIGAAADVAGGARGAKLAMLLDGENRAEAACRASRALFSPRQLRALCGAEDTPALPQPPSGLTLLQEVSWFELVGYMRSVLLRDSDAFAMASSLELRVPFVDEMVARCTAGVADALKLQGGVSKPLLRAAIADRVPPEILDRPKQGFTLPFAVWMRDTLRARIDGELTDEGLRRVGVTPSAARAIWHEFLRGRVSWSRPWALYALVRWARENECAVAADQSRES
jgi:asparagine synthase (glutamine-hydrolysing)